jgi:uncharacterized protein YcfJ
MCRSGFVLLLCGTLAATSGLASSQALAESSRTVYGTVLQVDPIIEQVEVAQPQEECIEQPVTYREPAVYRSARRDRVPAVLGAIIGGVIGHHIGRHGHRDAATVAGAALGYASVRDAQYYDDGYYRGGREVTRYEQRCFERNEYHVEEQVTGYDVTYEYEGETYQTVTDYHPGDSIELLVEVRPAR